MSLTLKHNLAAMNAMRAFGIVDRKQAKSTEKLSSGYRINRSADDAAGLAISEKMRRQIRGLTQASANAQDGISLVQTAEGALDEIHSMLQRGNELAVKAANGTLSDGDRAMVDSEIQQLKAAIDDIAGTTTFNDLNLFPKNGLSPKSLPTMETAHYDISLNLAEGTVSVESADAASARAGIDVTAKSGSVLADKIANEFIPNAAQQIFDTFPSLKGAMGSDVIKMALDVSYLDGPSNTLAYAQFAYYADGRTTNFKIKVDTADFTDADVTSASPKLEMLKSTIAHELTHSIMQYTMTEEMVGLKGTQEFPTWFKEGVAQLSGGGFTTGWNDYLHILAQPLTGENDTSQDAAFANYLRRYNVAGRPYGHGYLACAYMGYLASGNTTVSSASIAAGMNKIFADILAGSSFSEAVQKNTNGVSVNEIVNRINSGSANATEFVRQLSFNSKGGAGSVITSALNVGGTGILGTGAGTDQPFQIDPNQIFIDASNGGNSNIFLQVGSEAGQHIDIYLFHMDSEALGLNDTNTRSQDNAGDAITNFKDAIGYVSNVRSYLGAIQNRLEHTINNLDNIAENTADAESLIRDTDIASEMLLFTNNNVLRQAGQAMITQANHQPDIALSLLQ